MPSTTPTPTPPKNHHLRGLLMVLSAAIFWGFSGTIAQKLFHDYHFTTDWLVTVRLLIAGALLLLIARLQPGTTIQTITAPLKNRPDLIRLLTFSFIGLLAVQYTYFAAVETGNAAAATLLQYLAPLFVTLYLAFQHQKWPGKRELIAVLLALFGTFLLITNGSLEGLTLSQAAVLWGIASAVALAFYTLYPAPLLTRHGSALIIGWGMLIAGLAMTPFTQPWNLQGQHWDLTSFLYVAFVILFGTLIAFYLYIDSLRYLKPNETAILASAEPLTAALAAVLWLGVPMRPFEILGGLCIIITVTILSLQPKPSSN